MSLYGPKKNTAFTLYLPFRTWGTSEWRATPTIAAGDVQVSIDGGAFANTATLPAETPASGKAVKIVLSAAEMNGDAIVVRCVDQTANKEWEDTGEVIYTRAVTVDDLVRSTTPANTLDVSAGGEAGVDWANIGSPATVQALSGTTVKTATDVETDTANIQTRLPAVLVDGRMDASAGALAAGVVNAAAIATNAIDADALAADAVTEIQLGLATSAALATVQADTDDIQARLPAALTAGGNIKADALLLAGATPNNLSAAQVNAEVDSALDTAIPAIPTANSVNERIQTLDDNFTAARAAKLDEVTAARMAELDAANLPTDVAAVKTDTAAILVDTGTTLDGRIPAALVSGRMDSSVGAVAAGAITAAAIADGAIDAATFAAGAIDAAALAADAANEIVDAWLDRANGVETGVTPRQQMRAVAAMLAGIVSGAGTGTEVFKAIAAASDGTTRVTVTVDSNGNRSVVALNL